MQTRYKILIVVVLALTAFAFGRWSAPETIKTVEVEKKTEDKSKDKHSNTVIEEITMPDGTKKKVTTVVEDTKTETKKTLDSSKTSEETKTSAKTTVSALGGVKLSDTPQTVYGASVQRPVLGPLGIQVWCLSDKTVGAGISLTF